VACMNMDSGVFYKDNMYRSQGISLERGILHYNIAKGILAKCNKYHKRIIDPTINATSSCLLALPTTKARILCLDSFIIEYSSLRDFGPKGNRFIFI